MTSLDAVSCKENKSRFRPPISRFAFGFRSHRVYRIFLAPSSVFEARLVGECSYQKKRGRGVTLETTTKQSERDSNSGPPESHIQNTRPRCLPIFMFIQFVILLHKVEIYPEMHVNEIHLPHTRHHKVSSLTKFHQNTQTYIRYEVYENI